VSLNFTLNKNEKVKYYTKMKTYNPIVLRFLVQDNVNSLRVD